MAGVSGQRGSAGGGQGRTAAGELRQPSEAAGVTTGSCSSSGTAAAAVWSHPAVLEAVEEATAAAAGLGWEGGEGSWLLREHVY